MALLKDRDKQHLQEEFTKRLKNPVKLVVFTQTIACDFCEQTEQIAQEIASLSDKITVEVYNFVADKAVADQYGVDKIPATVIEGEQDYGIRFFGIPSGYEFSSLIEDIMMVSSGESIRLQRYSKDVSSGEVSRLKTLSPPPRTAQAYPGPTRVRPRSGRRFGPQP